jgi:hypothetical protein
MPNPNDYLTDNTLKTLFIGDTGTGKTGALASLAAAGYNLRILDLDKGLDILLGKNGYLRHPNSPYVKQNPKVLENLRYFTFTEPMANVNGQLFPRAATVWSNTMKTLSNWEEKDKDGKVIEKLGPLSSWTDKDVLVIDSLSMLSQAAMNFNLAMNGALLKVRSGFEGQRDMNAAQDLIRKFLMMLYDASVKCNVIVISHVKYTNEITVRKQEGDEAKQENYGTPQGYPNAIGAALSPQIGRWFNSMLIARSEVYGPVTKHKIFTSAQNTGGIVINAKSSAPLTVKGSYPLETGLADYFRDVRGE